MAYLLRKSDEVRRNLQNLPLYVRMAVDTPFRATCVEHARRRGPMDSIAPSYRQFSLFWDGFTSNLYPDLFDLMDGQSIRIHDAIIGASTYSLPESEEQLLRFWGRLCTESCYWTDQDAVARCDSTNFWYQPVRGRRPAPDGCEDPLPQLHHFLNEMPPLEYAPTPAQRAVAAAAIDDELAVDFNGLNIPTASDDGIDVVDEAERYTPEYYWTSDHQLHAEPEPFQLTLDRQRPLSPWEVEEWDHVWDPAAVANEENDNYWDEAH